MLPRVASCQKIYATRGIALPIRVEFYSQKNAVKEETAVKETSEQKKDDAKNAETPKTEVKKADSLTASEGAVKISVNAQMPEGSELTVTKLTPDRFAYQNIEAVMQKKDAGFDIAAVYDIAV